MPNSRHIDYDVVETLAHNVQQTHDDILIDRMHLGRMICSSNDCETARMMRNHAFEQLPIKALRVRFDLLQIQARFDIQIVSAGAMVEVEVDEAS